MLANPLIAVLPEQLPARWGQKFGLMRESVATIVMFGNGKDVEVEHKTSLRESELWDRTHI